MYQRIIVPLDGSDLAEQALTEARHLSTATGAEIHLLRVIDYTRLESYGPYGLAMEYTSLEPIINEEEAAATLYLEEQQALLAADGFEVTIETRRGPVTREIVKCSQPGDIIVMTSHGRGGISRWLLGSVAEDVVRHSDVPVFLTRANSSKSPMRTAE